MVQEPLKLESGAAVNLSDSHLTALRGYTMDQGDLSIHGVLRTMRTMELTGCTAVSYTHLDVYKRQGQRDGGNADVGEIPLTPGKHAFLLCSDGFWEYVDEEEMEAAPVSYTHLDVYKRQLR